MSDRPRLIEVAFPLKQASLDSVHEKNVRHGHISTLHIWPARRPLAACRAALIATLLPDPGSPEKRRALLEKLGGHVIQKFEKKKMPSGKIVDRPKEETVGGILHWGRESQPDLEWFREEIHKAYSGRAPKVLDPFAGGGAIPLEAMRLGCEATAIDVNPVAWLILKCTLEYPQQFAGHKRPLPEFVLTDEEFMEEFYKAHPSLVGTGKSISKRQYIMVFDALRSGKLSSPEADLAWHIRAWGGWVLNKARKELARLYPTYADFQPTTKQDVEWNRRDMKVVPTKDDGSLDLNLLNAEFDEKYLDDPDNPRWIPKPTVAYLWARTAICKNCRVKIPLLKTRWLCKKDRHRVLLAMQPNADKTGVVFGIHDNVPVVGGNTAQRREHDKRVGQGTMNRNGAWCPCCGREGTVAMEMEDIRQEGVAGRLGVMMTAVVVDGPATKEYRLPTKLELDLLSDTQERLEQISSRIPNGKLSEPIKPASTRSISCDLYGIDNFAKAFTTRQQLALLHFVSATRDLRSPECEQYGLTEWRDAIFDYLSLAVDRLADRSSVFCRWDIGYTKVNNTFSRFSLPMLWDFCETNPLSGVTGGYIGAVEWIAEVIEHCMKAERHAPAAKVLQASATQDTVGGPYDVILTDPPYYQAISYADISDYFYVWQKRLQTGVSHFSSELSPKESEVVQHIRSDKDRVVEKKKYEAGMSEAFRHAFSVLREDGRFAIVFAHKDPDAWETLANAMIRSGLVVTASWPIQTEMSNRGRAQDSAALASSLWLVCKKRAPEARAGWDNKVLEEMREKISSQLREYWDTGIRGPDFIWAATGPALEAYSKHPVVKKANEPGKIMEVHEFLQHVRRMVVNFVVGHVLSHVGDSQSAGGLDDITTYYLLHRNDFGLEEAPVGACILYAVSCGLSDSALADDYDILIRAGGIESEEEEEKQELQTTWAEDESEGEEGTGSKVKLRPWSQRKRVSMGYTQNGKPAPLIDQIHRLMHLWKAGDQHRVDEYIETNGVRGNQLFHRVLQSLVELSPHASEERSILESISNHLAVRGATVQPATQTIQSRLFDSHIEHGERGED